MAESEILNLFPNETIKIFIGKKMHNVQVDKIRATEYKYRYADINAKCAFPIKKIVRIDSMK